MIILPLILLSSCGNGRDVMDALTEKYAKEPQFEARVSVVTELTDNRQEYALSWEHSEEKDRMTVLEPEIISGISAETGKDTELVYDGMRLEIEPSGTQLSPVEALPELFIDWKAGQYLDYKFELIDGENTVAVTCEHQKRGLNLRQRVWFDCESLKPLKAEIYTEDRLTACFDFLLFDFTVQPENG